MPLLIAFSALLGLAVGSFLNVVIWRVPRGASIVHPASACPTCNHPISARDNVPLVSWIVLAGRCRHCRARITWRYPAIELGTAALFVGVALRFGFDPALPAYLYLAAVGLSLAVIDIDTHRLPDAITLPSYLVGAALLTVAALMEHAPRYLMHAVVGLAVMYGLYFALAVAKPGGMGWGDVKLAGVLGMYLGFLGWGALVVGAFAAFLLGGLLGIGLVITRHAGRKSKVPFGPHMVAGALIAVFAGHALANWYLHITIG